MNETLKIVLSLSISGGLMVLIFHLLRPIFKERLSKQWQYYIWLVVVARLILPFAPETNLIGTIFQGIDKSVDQTELYSPPTQQEHMVVETFPQNTVQTPIETTNNSIEKMLEPIGNNIWFC